MWSVHCFSKALLRKMYKRGWWNVYFKLTWNLSTEKYRKIALRDRTDPITQTDSNKYNSFVFWARRGKSEPEGGKEVSDSFPIFMTRGLQNKWPGGQGTAQPFFILLLFLTVYTGDTHSETGGPARLPMPRLLGPRGQINWHIVQIYLRKIRRFFLIQ